MSFARRPIPRTAVILAAVMALCYLLPTGVEAKSYRITRVDIDARLMSDGSMDVSEARTYDFTGSFSYAYRDMPRGGPVIFGDFEVLEEGRPYELSGSEEPGTYMISRDSERTRITWYYRASDIRRTFEFRYRAANAVEVYADAAVLYYKFLSEDWEKSQRNISLRIEPPAPLHREQIRQWLHGPPSAESSTTDRGEILARCPRLPGGRYLEVRALYPAGLFPDAETRPGSVRQGIMEEEAAWAEEANRIRRAELDRLAGREKRMRWGKWLMIALGLAGLWGWYQLYNKYGRRPAMPQFLDMVSEVPGKTTPALVGYLLHNRQVVGRDLVGTMLDLARRGFVELREETVEKKRFWGGMKQESEYCWDLKRAHWEEHASGLLGFERSLLQFLFGDLAEGGDSISLSEIKESRRDFIKFFRKWKQEVSEMGEEENWYDKASIRGAYYSLALGGSMLALTVVSIFLFEIWAVILGGAAVAVMVLSFLIYHRTSEGETEARHWKALQKYLKKYEFRSQSRGELLSRVSDYLVYGVVLGLSTKFYGELAGAIPESEHMRYVPWYVYHGAGSRTFSPAAFGEAFSSMVTATTTTMSSASGTGGGASAGGGGGAGSGGGGAG